MESAATLSLEESHSWCLDSNEAFLCIQNAETLCQSADSCNVWGRCGWTLMARSPTIALAWQGCQTLGAILQMHPPLQAPCWTTNGTC